MQISYLQKQIRKGAKKYKKETGVLPEIHDIREHEDESQFISIHFSRSVERQPGLTSGLPPHLTYSFNPNENYPNRYKWDGLKKWKDKAHETTAKP